MELVEHLRKERQVRNVVRVSAPGRVDELTAGQDSEGLNFPLLRQPSLLISEG